jgi:hypothetical protein
MVIVYAPVTLLLPFSVLLVLVILLSITRKIELFFTNLSSAEEDHLMQE